VNRNKVDRDDVYFLSDQILPLHSLNDAFDCLRAYALFNPEVITLQLQLNMGAKKTLIQSLKGLVQFPRPLRDQHILVFAEGEAADEARRGGASIVGANELVKHIEAGTLNEPFDHCLCTLEFLPNIKHLARTLKAKFPNVKRGTATDDIAGALMKFSSGESYEAVRDKPDEKHAWVRQAFARTDFSNDEMRHNLLALMNSIHTHKHKAVAKEKFYVEASVKSDLGPKLDLFVKEVVPA